MSSAPYNLSISAARSGALSPSPLQRSDEPSARQVRHGIATAIGVQDEQGCAARVAQADGEHPRDRAYPDALGADGSGKRLRRFTVEPAHAPHPATTP
jgi:hypothetical protein